MKTISGKQNTIHESILRSVNAGGRTMIEDFMNKQYRDSRYYTIHDDLSVSININNAVFRGINSFPCWFDDVLNLSIEYCEIENFTLPRKARLVEIKDCEKLKSIKTKEPSKIETLIIENCSNIDLSEIKDLEVKVVKIFKCDNLKSFKGLENVTRSLQLKSCKKLRTYDFKSNYYPEIFIYRCPLKYFEEPVLSHNITFKNLIKVNSLDFQTGVGTNLRIEECDEIESIKISGDNIETLVIDSCEELQSVSISVDCKESFSFCNLPKIDKYELPQRISGHVIFEEVKTIPEINCKRIIKR